MPNPRKPTPPAASSTNNGHGDPRPRLDGAGRMQNGGLTSWLTLSPVLKDSPSRTPKALASLGRESSIGGSSEHSLRRPALQRNQTLSPNTPATKSNSFAPTL